MVIPRFDLSVDGGDLLRVLGGLLSSPNPAAVAAYERRFAEWLGVRHAIFLPSARCGLFLILKAAGLAPGRRVMVPAWTHASVPAVAQAAGFELRFVDCDPATANCEADAVPEAAWDGVGAVVATHLYGGPVDAEAWVRAARARGAFVVEDCAQALGARLRGQRVGTFGDAACFSFALTKNYTTLGGGMVATARDDLAEALRGMVDEARFTAARTVLKPAIMGLGFRAATRPAVFAAAVYPALRLGWTLAGRDLLHALFDEPVRFAAPSGMVPRPHPAQAALGMRQLEGLDAANERRAAVGRRLAELLDGLPGLGVPRWRADSSPIFMSFMIRARDRTRMLRELLERGVDTSPGYLRANPRRFGCDDACPRADALERQQVHLPVYPRLQAREVEHVARSVRAAAASLAPGPVEEVAV